MEGSGFVDQHHGQHVLKANVGNVAVVHDAGLICRQVHGDLLHLVRLERALLANILQSIERSLNRRTHGPLLDISADDLVAFAQLVDESRGISLRQAGE